jgi:hypothetical protein
MSQHFFSPKTDFLPKILIFAKINKVLSIKEKKVKKWFKINYLFVKSKLKWMILVLPSLFRSTKLQNDSSEINWLKVICSKHRNMMILTKKSKTHIVEGCFNNEFLTLKVQFFHFSFFIISKSIDDFLHLL